MKIALLTIVDENFRDIADRTFPSMRRYAEAFGLEFLNMPPGVPDRPPAWGKVHRIREILQSGYDYCFYVDADTIFVRFDSDIRDHIAAAKDLHLCWHDQDNSESYADIRGHFNTGVMVWRNCTWSIDFLDEIWRQTDFIDHGWWEQGALLHLLGYRSVLGAAADESDPARAAHVQRLPVDWNVLVGYTDAPDPVIRHFAGRPMPRRLADLDRELAFQPMREMLPPHARRVLAQQLNLMAHQSRQADEQASQAAQAFEQTAHQMTIAQSEAQEAERQRKIAQDHAEAAERQRKAAQDHAEEADRQRKATQDRAEEADRQRKAAQDRAEEAERQATIARSRAEQALSDRDALLQSPARLATAWWRAARGKLGV
jgi:nucleotide-diphospho-sugar transferase